LLRTGEGIDTTTGEGRRQAGHRGWGALTGPGFADAHPDVVDEENALAARAATTPVAYMKQFQAINGWDAVDSLVGTAVPIVVGHGNADPLVPYANGVNLSSKLGVELVTYEGSGHWLEVERAAEVAQLAKDHFAKAAAQGR
jgi:pimeloyl-ACP methyl ester carboxylesterase